MKTEMKKRKKHKKKEKKRKENKERNDEKKIIKDWSSERNDICENKK